MKRRGSIAILLEEFEGLVKICGPRLGSALPDNNLNGLDSRSKQQKYNSFNFYSRFVDLRHTFPEEARDEGLVKICGPRLGPAPPDNNFNGRDSRRKQQNYNSSNSHPRPVSLRHTFPEGARGAHGRVVVAFGRVNTWVIVTRHVSLIGVELLLKPIRTAVVAVIGLWA